MTPEIAELRATVELIQLLLYAAAAVIMSWNCYLTLALFRVQKSDAVQRLSLSQGNKRFDALTSADSSTAARVDLLSRDVVSVSKEAVVREECDRKHDRLDSKIDKLLDAQAEVKTTMTEMCGSMDGRFQAISDLLGRIEIGVRGDD